MLASWRLTTTPTHNSGEHSSHITHSHFHIRSSYLACKNRNWLGSINIYWKNEWNCFPLILRYKLTLCIYNPEKLGWEQLASLAPYFHILRHEKDAPCKSFLSTGSVGNAQFAWCFIGLSGQCSAFSTGHLAFLHSCIALHLMAVQSDGLQAVEEK